MATIIRSEFIDWDTIIHFTNDGRVIKIQYPCVNSDDVEIMSREDYEDRKKNGTL